MQSPWDILRNSREEVARQGRAHRVLLVVIRSGESAGRKDNGSHAKMHEGTWFREGRKECF